MCRELRIYYGCVIIGIGVVNYRKGCVLLVRLSYLFCFEMITFEKKFI